MGQQMGNSAPLYSLGPGLNFGVIVLKRVYFAIKYKLRVFFFVFAFIPQKERERESQLLKQHSWGEEDYLRFRVHQQKTAHFK